MKKKFYQTNWFLFLMLIFCPFIGVIVLWTCHKEKGIIFKLIISFIVFLGLVFCLALGNTGTSNKELNQTTHIQEQIDENISKDLNQEKETQKKDKSQEQDNSKSFDFKYLLNMKTQEISLMNGTKTKKVGTALKFLGDNSFISESSIEDVKEFIQERIKPVEDNYNYIIIDFLLSKNGLIYRNGIIEYGKLHKNNKDFYFEKQEDIFGTYMTYDDNDIRKLINDVKKIED